MKKWKWPWLLLLAMLLCISPARVKAESIYDASVYGNPHVTFTPNGQAWTTDYMEKDYEQVENREEIITGEGSTLPEMQVGQHRYPIKKNGLLHVEKWVAHYTPGNCIHALYHGKGDYYNGLPVNDDANCFQFFKNGWVAICADCKKEISLLFYMDRETAKSLTTIPLGMDYFYVCPHCNNLDQARAPIHECEDISWNKYAVEYKENGFGVTGAMAVSTFMYNNETLYEGETITAETRLRKNRFMREGYEFLGWNTKKDGSGDFYADEAEVLNLATENKATVILYAQWKSSKSTLHIHPGSGKLDGASGIASVTQKHGSTVDVSASRLTPPQGAIVSFNTNGGSAVANIQTERYFKEWSISHPFHGELLGETYHFTGANGSEDTITAIYEHRSIILPSTTKAGAQFGGWYKDPGCTQLVGPAGAEVYITQNTTLYAQWVSLQLTATDDYTVHGGTGAVDLKWVNTSGSSMTYKVYQMREGGSWTQHKNIGVANSSVNVTFHVSGAAKTYTVPYTGLYTLTVTGARGGNYGTMAGGAGGRVKANVFLRAGEVLTYNIGSTSGYNGGGSGNPYANGGGMTSLSSNSKGILMIAGGGGGASDLLGGGPGGAQTSLTGNSYGGSGVVGGGGGYRGGNAGEAIYHVHDVNTCSYHEHNGNAATGGTCYKSNVCGGTSFKQNGGEFWYWVPHWDIGGSGICAQCNYDFGTNGNDAHAHEVTYPTSYTCHKCGTTFDSKPPSCTAGAGYSLSCTIPAGYNCGKTTTTVESAKTAYGGSNYVNNTYCTLLSSEAGVNGGEGSLHIYLAEASCVDGLLLNDVAAKDLAAPQAVSSYNISAVGDGSVRINWQAPADNGTLYYHQVAAHELTKGVEICRSNITQNTLTSGVKGYYYIVNQNAGTVVTKTNSAYTSNASVEVTVLEVKQYLHLAAVDRSGNLSGTFHVTIDTKDALINWPVYTQQIALSGTQDNVYHAGEDTYYVRADGRAAFIASYTAYMNHAALKDYQINYDIFQIDSEGARQFYKVYAPSIDIIAETHEYNTRDLWRDMDGAPILQDGVYTKVSRSNGCKNLSIAQGFVVAPEQNGKTITLMPISGAAMKNGNIQYSDYALDVQNGVTVIADGQAPEIAGSDGLALWSGREEVFEASLWAEDGGSGMREFYCVIENRDQYSVKRVDAADGQQLLLEILPGDPILDGDVEIHFYAVDNVGNCQHIAVENPFFSMEASVERMRSPKDRAFCAGDSGVVQVDTYGYADRIEVVYPPQWQQWGFGERMETIYGENRTYHKQETVQFMVPLKATEGGYEFVVRAHKGTGQSLEQVLQIQVEGSILDELHTRLR